ncbi:DUF3244 domain-containing protein [uncultured Alistipes sp.]|jgi:hypothetical protein|uniref:DUF3244 domain-containing protein n=1 Tax=uncultured Alistipes sp. TaxID=538949 RepID=UPI0025E5EAA7|nr:DUF3244 domain-containing protein [uncultured Alistipes sp.]
MKKFSVLLLGVLIVSGICGHSLFADIQQSTGKTDIIVIKDSSGDESELPRPRNIVLVPIVAYYEAGIVHLNFMEDIGQLTVEVVNTTTGEQWFEMGDSADGGMNIHVSGEYGNYVLYIETESGATFSGNFTL